MAETNSFLKSASKALDMAIPLLMRKQQMDTAKAAAAQAQANSDRAFMMEATKVKNKMVADRIKLRLEPLIEMMGKSIEGGNQQMFNQLVPQIEGLTGAQFPTETTMPANLANEKRNILDMIQQQPMMPKQPITNEMQLKMQNPELWEKLLKRETEIKRETKQAEVPTEIRSFELFKYGKESPDKRGSVAYRDDYLGYLKDKSNVTTAPSKTEPKILRQEFINQSKEFVKVRDSYNRIKVSYKNPSAAGDLSMIFNYMKMLDPGSVVRESEFATAAASGAFGERIKAQVGKVLAGERLSPVMRKDFLDRSIQLYGQQEKSHKKLRSEYDRLSKELKVEPSNVIIDYITEQTKIENKEYEIGEVYEDANGIEMKYLGKDASGNDMWE
ncbi:MAG: hypothetical protein ABIJ59_09875 [Pseudomonadota bacterium]